MTTYRQPPNILKYEHKKCPLSNEQVTAAQRDIKVYQTVTVGKDIPLFRNMQAILEKSSMLYSFMLIDYIHYLQKRYICNGLVITNNESRERRKLYYCKI